MRLKIDALPEIDLDEALRYLRGGEDSLADVRAASEELYRIARPAACAARFSLRRIGFRLFCGETELGGNAIAERLQDCDDVVLLALTLGFETDKQIARLSNLSPYKALLLDGCASAAVEGLADMAQRQAARELLEENEGFVPRFSPGYADLPLSLQGPLLSMVNATRLIGLTVGASLMLSPIKSVTAIVGIQQITRLGEIKLSCRLNCVGCNMLSCPYRKR